MQSFLLHFLISFQSNVKSNSFSSASSFLHIQSGMTFQEYLQKNIFSPLGMDQTSFDFWNDALAYKPKRPINYYKYYSKHFKRYFDKKATPYFIKKNIFPFTIYLIYSHRYLEYRRNKLIC